MTISDNFRQFIPYGGTLLRYPYITAETDRAATRSYTTTATTTRIYFTFVLTIILTLLYAPTCITFAMIQSAYLQKLARDTSRQ